jgi:hypothetical protein
MVPRGGLRWIVREARRRDRAARNSRRPPGAHGEGAVGGTEFRVAPTAQPLAASLPCSFTDVRLRANQADEARRFPNDRALAAAPEAEDGFFLVPPVVENVNP